MTANLPASILARLLVLAKQRGDDYSLVLNRFAMERLLARVSVSLHAERFLLKGARLVHCGTTRPIARLRMPTCWALARTMKPT